jgi:hypothetical protein
VDEIIAEEMKQHTSDAAPPIVDSKELDDAMKFVQSNLDTFLVLIRLGFIRLLGEYGEPVLAFIQSEGMKRKLATQRDSEADGYTEKVKHLHAVLGNHIGQQGDLGASREYSTLSVALCKSTMIHLYSEEDKKDCTRRNAVNESNRVREEVKDL